MQTLEKFIRILENYVEADEIKAEDNFKLDLGMSSFDIVCVMSDVKTEFGFDLKAADFVANKTIGDMAGYIQASV